MPNYLTEAQKQCRCRPEENPALFDSRIVGLAFLKKVPRPFAVFATSHAEWERRSAALHFHSRPDKQSKRKQRRRRQFGKLCHHLRPLFF